jgi:cystathionine gamma-synthase
MKIETQAGHAGRGIDPATGAVTPPIQLSTTFERNPDGEYPLGFSYSREGNPTRPSLEECLAALEGGKEALAFSSGLGVATSQCEGSPELRSAFSISARALAICSGVETSNTFGLRGLRVASN